MADSYQINLGSLRSSLKLTLHTHHASRMWFGRPRTDEKPGMIGLSGFSNIINRITVSAAKDDPYSDYFLILIEEKIAETEQALKDIDHRLDLVMANLPSQLELGNNLSVQPFQLPLYLSSPLAFKSVYLLTQYDELVRRILLAWHIGLIDSWQPPQVEVEAEPAGESADATDKPSSSATRIKELWLDEGAATLRRLFSVGQRYKGFSGATRDDFAAKNARAENARQMYAFLGELPKGVLEGTRRSKFAPVIQRPGEAKASPHDSEDDAGDSANEDEHWGALSSAPKATSTGEA